MAAANDYYVYVYSHPDTRQPFYVGKGRGGRALAHMDFEDAENEKQEMIASLRKQGRKPIVEIVQWGLSEDAAFFAESALIQHIGLNWMTNRQQGRGTEKLHADFIEYIRDKKPLQITARGGVKMLVLCANQFYRPGMSRFELYDAIRGNLKVNPTSVEECRYALVVYRGFVLDIYKDLQTIDAGSEARAFTSNEEPIGCDLVAQFASDIMVHRYVGRELKANFGFGRFTYEEIKLPRGRF